MTEWRDIPSLSALRAFEAMARLGGFSAAARELNVTHAAIAQHVRALEAELEQQLVIREGRGMGLTQVGRSLADALGDGFGAIELGIRAIRDMSADRPLQIALTPSFAENWLMPRIGAFWQAHPDIKLALVPGFEVVDLKRDGFDMAIRYGRGDWDGLRSEPLVSAAHVLVGAPDYLEGLDRDLGKVQWLLETNRSEPQLWVSSQGIEIAPERVTEFQTNSMVLAATRAGHGVSVQGRALVERDLREGRLASLYDGDEERLAYYLVTRPGRIAPRLAAFMGWLNGEV